MRKLILAVGLLVGSVTASAQSIIVNEFYRGGNLSTGDEWIEVLLLSDLTAIELQGYLVGDSQTATTSKLNAIWARPASRMSRKGSSTTSRSEATMAVACWPGSAA